MDTGMAAAAAAAPRCFEEGMGVGAGVSGVAVGTDVGLGVVGFGVG